MAKFTLTIDCKDFAFEDTFATIAVKLSVLADELNDIETQPTAAGFHGYFGQVHDADGNEIGEWKYQP